MAAMGLSTKRAFNLVAENDCKTTNHLRTFDLSVRMKANRHVQMSININLKRNIVQ